MSMSTENKKVSLFIIIFYLMAIMEYFLTAILIYIKEDYKIVNLVPLVELSKLISNYLLIDGIITYNDSQVRAFWIFSTFTLCLKYIYFQIQKIKLSETLIDLIIQLVKMIAVWYIFHSYNHEFIWSHYREKGLNAEQNCKSF